MKKEAPEELSILIHRFGRVIETALAYEIFNKNEINIGEVYTIQDDTQRVHITHTLLISFYSFIFSIFDTQSKAISFVDVHKKLEDRYEEIEDLIEIGNLVIQVWTKNENLFTIIRHSIGFHLSKNNKGIKHGYEQFKNLSPDIPYLILHGLRFYFRIANSYFIFNEAYIESPIFIQNKELIKHYKELIKDV